MDEHAPDTPHRIRQNLERVRARMAAAAERAGRDPAGLTLVAVTKSVTLGPMEAVLAAGVTHLGENRVEAAGEKVPAFARRGGLCRHMIGRVQRRKAREVVALFDRVDAVDRLRLAESLQRQCEDQDRRLEILLQVNVAGEAAKQGVAPEELPALVAAVRSLDARLALRGLMTMAPYDAPDDLLRTVFRRLRRLCDERALPVCSMGMTNDFELAVEEGATEIRVGRALFEGLPPEAFYPAP